MIIDNSALVDLCSGDQNLKEYVQAKIGNSLLVAPYLLEFEFYSWLKKHKHTRTLSEENTRALLARFEKLQIRYLPTQRLSQSIMGIAQSMSSYDAVYVALARKLELPLLTSDKKLFHAAKAECEIILISK